MDWRQNSGGRPCILLGQSAGLPPRQTRRWMPSRPSHPAFANAHQCSCVCPVVVDGAPRHTQPLHAAKRGAGLVASLWVRVLRAPCLGVLPLPGRRLVVPVRGLSRGARCVLVRAPCGLLYACAKQYAYTKSKMLAVGLAYPFLSLVQARNDCRRAASSAS